MLQLPIDLDSTNSVVCNISKRTAKATLLREAKVLVWDEIAMMNKKGVEAVNRSLQDIRENSELMGGLLVIFAGDFRQTLPVIKRGTMADEINACLKSSHLWKYVKTYQLTKNMRVKGTNRAAKEFADYLLQIGNGTANLNVNHERIELSGIIGKLHADRKSLMDSVYPNLSENIANIQWISERGILAVTNETVENINFEIMSTLRGESRTYYAVDSVTNDNDTVVYPTEFLNSLQPSGMPQYRLVLKVGTPIMMLRNLDPPKLCNGTRLVIKSLHNYVIEGTILTGQWKGENVIIPRIPLISNDSVIEFKRLQFPIKVAFAMTVNKAQGQSFNVVGVNLQQEVFSHGQLYVAFSRTTDAKNLHILTKDNSSSTKNIVYKRVLN